MGKRHTNSNMISLRRPILFLIRITVIALSLIHSGVCVRKNPSDTPQGTLNCGKCRMIFNELNTFPNGAGQFIELKRACEIPPSKVFQVKMSNYKIAFITHDGYLVGVCSLGQQDGNKFARTRDGNIIFYLIGGSLINGVDMKLEECQFAASYQVSAENRMPLGENAPIGMLLLYSKDIETLRGVTLDVTHDINMKTKIEFSLEQVLLKYLQDIGSILRDWAQYYDSDQRSLSRCKEVLKDKVVVDWIPMQPEHWKLAKETPGAVNECSSAVEFHIEDYLPPLKKPRTDGYGAHTCEITTDDPEIDMSHTITSHLTYRQQFQEAVNLLSQAVTVEESTQSQVLDNVQHNPLIDYFNIEIENERYVSVRPKPTTQEEFEKDLARSAPFIWDDCDRFDAKDFLNAARENGKLSPYSYEDINNPGTCNWLEWLPVAKTVRCKFCHRLWNQEIIFDQTRHIHKIVTVGQGYTKGTHAKYDNRRLIKSHQESDLHKIAVEYHRLFDEGKRGKQLEQDFKAVGGPYRNFLNATEHLFAAVFAATKMDIPFYRSPWLNNLLINFNVSIGTTYLNPVGQKEILMSQSATLHKEMCVFLKDKKPKFSILIDTSSDIASLYSIAILFQTFDADGIVRVIVYKVVAVNVRETTENLFKILVDEFKSDGLLEWVREKCIGFGTDGGANVKKLKNNLNHITDHEIMYVYCHAHRLERAVKRAWGKTKLLIDVDVLVNSLYTMFNSRSPRKKLIMVQKIKELEDTKFELKPVKNIRWVNSKRRAVKTVIKHWKTIVLALESVESDKSFPNPQRDSARSLLAKMKSPSVIITLAFVADACDQMALISLNLQDEGSTLIGKKRRREEMKKGLVLLKTTTGESVNLILKSTKVVGQESTATLEDFDGKQLIIHGIKVNSPEGSPSGTLRAQIEAYVDSLVSQVDAYFPNDPTDHLDYLDAKQWPLVGIETYGNSEILLANSGLQWNYPASGFLVGWLHLKSAISQSSDYKMWKSRKPEEFWSHYLKVEAGWTPEWRTVITNIITVPASTAHVERTYSYYTSIKTVNRYNLNIATVDAIIRVQINGPDSISEFAKEAHVFVKDFILSGHLRSDDVDRQYKQPRATDDRNLQITEDDCHEDLEEATVLSYLTEKTTHSFQESSEELVDYPDDDALPGENNFNYES